MAEENKVLEEIKSKMTSTPDFGNFKVALNISTKIKQFKEAKELKKIVKTFYDNTIGKNELSAKKLEKAFSNFEKGINKIKGKIQEGSDLLGVLNLATELATAEINKLENDAKKDIKLSKELSTLFDETTTEFNGKKSKDFFSSSGLCTPEQYIQQEFKTRYDESTLKNSLKKSSRTKKALEKLCDCKSGFISNLERIVKEELQCLKKYHRKPSILYSNVKTSINKLIYAHEHPPSEKNDATAQKAGPTSEQNDATAQKTELTPPPQFTPLPTQNVPQNKPKHSVTRQRTIARRNLSRKAPTQQ